ncbi:basic proline-rich [Limosa lapponica baueri]|uniref:Basic proline-rich n=1 Tax=Limosa lapponica baueri TaxID=1758121 RepID=A0A2I0UD71_LIMLA|nr:basic proline-rich [Limosa lapponica baueri]
MCTRLQDYDIIGIKETWCDDWSVGMEGHWLFMKEKQGRRDGGLALYVDGQLECMDLQLGMDKNQTER